MESQAARISRRKFLSGAAGAAVLSAAPQRILSASSALWSPGSNLTQAAAAGLRPATIRVSPTGPGIAFDPDQALGSSMDILSHDVVEKIYTEPMVKQCLSAGWGPITYRQNTELSIAAWHWNPHGAWSDAANRRGYFTGSVELKDPIHHSYGYPLPHRGTTRNGGAEHGYSRLTDGNAETYWKSNPYLASRFTGEPDSAHPQWIVIDLGSHEPITHLRIDWHEPHARHYEVQYWSARKTNGEKKSVEKENGDAATTRNPMDAPASGVWSGFPGGIVADGKGGTITLELATTPVRTRYLRIWMTESSNTADSRPGAMHDPADPRSSAGYAIREIYVGTLTPTGDFVDLVQHRPDQNQTATYCSSIDPWHSDSDLDDHGDQTGFDLFFTSGITNNLPAMIPVSMLYGTPDDAAAQMAYLKKRGYAISYVEMGEEPDGQNMLPEDYAELYLQFAAAMHRVDPKLKLGGPVFEGVNEDIKVWPDAQGRTSWLGRFLDYLKARNRLSDLAFMSFEHYPFPPCDIVWADLYREPELVAHILDVWRNDGLPANVPMMNTESNVTYGNAEEMADIFAALWLADSVGAFLTAGGAAYYHSPIQPEPLRPGCRGYGTYGNYVADENLNIRAFTAQYHASRLINLEWVQHRAGVHKLHPAVCDLKDGAGHILITAYAVNRPDGQWSLMLINKDQLNPHEVRIAFGDAETGRNFFSGAISMVTFGSEQYMWKSDGPNGHPEPNLPPVTKTIPASLSKVTLPKASVTVLRGKVEG
ncbi:MAG TPA: discoidin domain-containing protein [Terriglobales bacterium]|nr:discoidin domain-containing protein [Terriglobales bacterium]